jgi:hypothetical protein
MNEIEVALDWREIEAAKIQSMLSTRFFGRRGWRFVGFVATLTGIFSYFLGAVLLGPGASGALAVLAAILVFALLATRLQNKLGRAMFDLPARQQPSAVMLDAAGIAAPGALIAGRIPWRWVTEIVDSDDTLLVLFSPVEFIPLADSGLPDGMTRETLKAQIETWREAAA